MIHWRSWTLFLVVVLLPIVIGKERGECGADGSSNCCQGQCEIGEGDCDYHSDCLDGLLCDYDWFWGQDHCIAGPNTKHYDWGAWEDWSECSVTCGGPGQKTRKRTCIPPVNGGDLCPSESQTEVDTCDTDVCPPAYAHVQIGCSGIGYSFNEKADKCKIDSQLIPNSGAYGTDYNQCYDLCKEQDGCELFQFINTNSQKNWWCTLMMGIDCIEDLSWVDVETKKNSTIGFLTCTKQPVDGGWSQWSEWTDCSNSCGGGKHERSRQCDSPAPNYGGVDCASDGSNSTETETCNDQPCPICADIQSNCNGTGWGFTEDANELKVFADEDWLIPNSGNYATDYNMCHDLCQAENECAMFQFVNTNSGKNWWCILMKGAECVKENWIEEETAKESAIGFLTCDKLSLAVHGGWGQWSDWDTCSVSCGGGTHGRTRSCDSPAPKHGGSECTVDGSSAAESTACNTDVCPLTGCPSDQFFCSNDDKKCIPVSDKCNYLNDCGDNQDEQGCKEDCSLKHTSWNDDGSGDLWYLDRHQLDCGGSGNVLTGFKLQSSGGKIRYQYKCCTMTQKICQNTLKENDYTLGSEEAVYLDRQPVSCGTNGFLNNFVMQSSNGNIRYKYNCCNLDDSQHKTNSKCYNDYTSYDVDGDGNGKTWYLDRHYVQCKHRWFLSSFHLERNSGLDKWRYRYTCCHVES